MIVELGPGLVEFLHVLFGHLRAFLTLGQLGGDDAAPPDPTRQEFSESRHL